MTHHFTPAQLTALEAAGFELTGSTNGRMLLHTGKHRIAAVPSLACTGTVFLLFDYGRSQTHATDAAEIRAFVERFQIPVAV